MVMVVKISRPMHQEWVEVLFLDTNCNIWQVGERDIVGYPINKSINFKLELPVVNR